MSDSIDDLKPIEFDWKDDDIYISTSSDDGYTITLDSGSIPPLTAYDLQNMSMSGSVSLGYGAVPPSNITINSASAHSMSNANTIYSVGAGSGSVGAGSTYTMGSVGISSPVLSSSETKLEINCNEGDIVFNTKKNKVVWDTFVDDVNMIKRMFMSMSNNEDLMKKYPEIQDMLAEWMLRELKK
jgi:hypothetical protein